MVGKPVFREVLGEREQGASDEDGYQSDIRGWRAWELALRCQ